ncbi:MAG: ribonuclease H-like domain-containing protein [Candidatus Omnitrophica bacterium]|nr:ribonuclease H-like domain-containing protein [Candidatus Omnitrophota bacterium]
MVKLFLDIETLPAEESFKAEIQKGILAPRGPKKKAAKVAAAPATPKELEEQLRQTALSGDFGRILCIGYCKEPPAGSSAEILQGGEREILEKFWVIARDVDLFIGHNVMEFDLRFIYKRSIIHKVRPTKNDLSFARYRSQPIYDIMREWEKWDVQTYTSLDRMAKVLGLETSKKGLSGDKVYDAFLAGKLNEIYEYCKADVELTRQIYKRMNFEI